MDIPFQGRYDQATVNRAVALVTRPPVWGMRLRWGLLVAFVPVFAYLALPVLAQASPSASDSTLLTRLTFILLLLAAFAVLPYFNTFRLARGLWRQPSMQADRAGAISEQGVVYRAHDGDRLLEWREFARHREAPDLIVLTTTKGGLIMLPRSFFASDEAWGQVRAAVEGKMGKG